MSKIIGNTVATPMTIPDWNQDNPNRADYIKNKPEIVSKEYVDEKLENIDASTPKKVIEFDNGLSIESREDGIYLVGENEDGIEESIRLYSGGNASYASEAGYAEGAMHAESANSAEMADYAYIAQSDEECRALKGTEVIDEGDYGDVTHPIVDGYEISYGIISNSIDAYIAKDSEVKLGFISGLHFTTPSEMPQNYSQFPETIYFKGDSVVDGRLVPEKEMRYSIVFFFDGNLLVGCALGVPAPPVEEEVIE